MIGDYPTQLDEIDQWLNDNFGILPGACSSTENLRYSVARRVAEALWPNNQSLSDANKRLEEIARKGLENAHTVDFSKQYENSMKILQKAKINLPSDVNLEEEARKYLTDNFTQPSEEPIPLEEARYSLWLDDVITLARHFYILGLKNNIPITQITLDELAKEGGIV